MRFRVVGANRQTNARMILEFEAESKAAAERKATQAGMSVTRVEDITDGYIAPAMEPAGEGHRRGRAGGSGCLRRVLVLVVLAVALWFLWPPIARWFHSLR